jgi:DNA-binding transcriptional MerR regulator
MEQLQALAQAQWSLEDFVQAVNRLLPEVLPDARANTRVREAVTARLVRHYTTEGLLDEPLRQGREARYTYRHLLQVLVVRRLLAAGYSASAIAQFAIVHTNTELETLVQGDIQLTIASNPSALVPRAPSSPAPSQQNSALEFLQQIQTQTPSARSKSKPHLFSAPPPPSAPPVQLTRARQQQPPPPASVAPCEATLPLPDPTPWLRLEIAPGLEIQVSPAFVWPSEATAQAKLCDRILDTIQRLSPSSAESGESIR